VLAACTRAGDPTPPAPPPRPPAVAPANRDPITLAIAAPSPSAPSQPSTDRFGVRWRVQLPGLDPGTDDTDTELVIGDEVFVSLPVLAVAHDEIVVFDLATGARRRTATLAHTGLVAAGGALVATNGDEEFGLDKQTLRPTWRARGSIVSAAGDYLLETPVRLRRASDGRVMWENTERLFTAWGTSPRLDGDTLYVQAYVGADSERVAAIDVATGAVRWRSRGYLRSASAGHVVIQDASASGPSVRIFDASGVVRWLGPGAWASLRGNLAIATTADGTTTVIELSSNRVLWRRANLWPIDSDDTWLYGRSQSNALEIIDLASGQLAGEMQLGFSSGELALHGAPVFRVGAWLFGLGPRAAPEPRAPVDARGCLIVMGCPGNQYVPTGAKVTLDGTTTATTDRRGCFSARTTLGLGPARVEIASGTATPLQVDNPFPTAVVFDRALVTLRALYIGGGCHDSVPGVFP